MGSLLELFCFRLIDLDLGFQCDLLLYSGYTLLRPQIPVGGFTVPMFADYTSCLY